MLARALLHHCPTPNVRRPSYTLLPQQCATLAPWPVDTWPAPESPLPTHKQSPQGATYGRSTCIQHMFYMYPTYVLHVSNICSTCIQHMGVLHVSRVKRNSGMQRAVSRYCSRVSRYCSRVSRYCSRVSRCSRPHPHPNRACVFGAQVHH